jgi:hypothetical protein
MAQGRGTRRFGTVIWSAVLLAALLLAGRPAGAFAAATETVDNIARAPELYDEHVVSVTGAISDVGTFVDDAGQQFLLFRLADGYRSIIVLVGAQAADLRPGRRVQVTGVFHSGVFLSAVIASPDGQPGVLQALAIADPP